MSESHIAVTDYTPPSAGRTKTFDFPINNATDCFVFYATMPQRDICNALLTSPNNVTSPLFSCKDLYSSTVGNDNWIGDLKRLSFSTPIAANVNTNIPGQWNCQMKFDASLGIPAVKIAERIVLPHVSCNYVLPLNIVLYARKVNRDKKIGWVKDEMKRVELVYAQAGIQLVYSDPVINDLPSGGVTDDFDSTITGNIVTTNAQADKLSIIVIEDLKVSVLNEAGIAGGIPGPQGFVTNRTAVLVLLPSRPTDPIAVNKGFMGLTIAHEIGHYLGLTHASAQTDNTNLMFPRLGALSTGKLNEQQKFILRNMPIVEIVSSQIQKTPVTSISITIQTGTRWPTWADGPGTDMNVAFAFIDSSGKALQSWELNNWGNDFESGSTDTFNPSPQPTLYVEDIKGWRVQTSWSADMWIPFLGGWDAWHFYKITIQINGATVYDSVIDTFMDFESGKNTISRNIP